MAAFLLFGRRAAGHLTALLVLVVLDAALPLLLPGDPVAALLGPDALVDLNGAERAAWLAGHGLDGPPWRGVLASLAALGRFDMGISFAHRAPVAELLAQHLSWTLLLVGCALPLALGLGLALALEAACAQGRALDRVLTGAMLAVESLPVFVLALLLVAGFAYGLPWFPANGARAPFAAAGGAAALADGAAHLVLPVCALALPAAAGTFLCARAAAVTALARAFMTTARAQGAGPVALRYRHLAPAVWPLLAARLGATGARLLAGALYVETVFAYPGINLLLTDALARHDYPLVRGAVLALGLLVFGLNLLGDAAGARHARRTGRPP